MTCSMSAAKADPRFFKPCALIRWFLSLLACVVAPRLWAVSAALPQPPAPVPGLEEIIDDRANRAVRDELVQWRTALVTQHNLWMETAAGFDTRYSERKLVADSAEARAAAAEEARIKRELSAYQIKLDAYRRDIGRLRLR